MRGFLFGSLGLIALYALIQPNAATMAQSGSNVLVSLAQRLLSPNVAGIPQRKSSGGQTGSAAPATTPGTINV